MNLENKFAKKKAERYLGKQIRQKEGKKLGEIDSPSRARVM
jgi:hypothetical protein